MNVCLLSSTYPPANTEGIPRQRQALAAALARQGHNVHVITCGQAGKVRYENNLTIHEVELSAALSSYSSRHPQIDKTIALSQALYEGLALAEADCLFDVVDAPLWSAQGFVPINYANSPVVIWLQTTLAQILHLNNQATGPYEKSLLALDKYCLDHASGILADLHSILAEAQRNYGFPGIIPTGVAHLGLPTIFKLAAANHNPATTEALIVGRLEQRKGTPWLFSLLPAILNRHTDLSVRFLGVDNSASDGWFNQNGCNYVDFFHARYPELSNRVFFEGYVSEERLQACYQNASFILVASLYELFGLVYLEAMRNGLPVITMAIDAAKEIFPRGEDDGAILVPLGDHDQFSAAVSRLVEIPYLRSKIGDSGFRNFNKTFTSDLMADATVEFYQKVIDHRPQRNFSPKKIYQVMELLDQGDAVSTIAINNAAIFGQSGQPYQILARYTHPEVASFTLPLHVALKQDRCGLIFHYWNYNSSTWMLNAIDGPKALYFHNITPPHYFAKGTPALS